MQLTDPSVDSANPELLCAFVEYTPAAVAMLDRDLRYLLTSRRWITDYALENQDFIGRFHYEILPLFENEALEIPPDASPSTAQHFNRWQEIYALCLAGKTQRSDSDYFIRADGSRQNVKWEIQPWRIATGEIGGVIIFTQFQEPLSYVKNPLQKKEEDYRCQDLRIRLPSPPNLGETRFTPPKVGKSGGQNDGVCVSPGCVRETATEGIWGSADLTNTIEQLQQEIAERRQAQALLQESEERYRSLIGALTEGIILQEATGVIRTYNEAAERILGLSAEQLMGEVAIDPRWYAVKEDGKPLSRGENPIAVTLRTGESLTDVVMGIYKPDSTLTWLRINSQPLFRPNESQPYAAVASCMDITKDKHIGAELSESEERFRTTFEQAAVGINHTSIDGRFVRVNQKFCDITGYTREELLELTFQDITHPDGQLVEWEQMHEAELSPRESLLAGEIQTASVEKRYLRKDGKSIWVQITASLVRTAQGDPKYFLNVVQDISIRKAAASALRDSEAQLRELFAREALLNRLSMQIRNSLELSTILETAVQEIRQILQIERCQFALYRTHDTQPYWEVIKEARNLDLSEYTDRYPAEIIGSVTQQLLKLKTIQVDDVETMSDPIFQQFLRSLGCTSMLSLPMQTPSGTIGVFHCIHSSEARPWSDSEVELINAVKDQLLIAIKQAELYAASRTATQKAQEKAAQLQNTLYELQRTQAQLIQVEKMSSLGQLVAGVAHEINNPVNFIYGNLIYAQQYFQDLLGLVQLYRSAYPNPPEVIQERIDSVDLDFLMTDLTQLQDSMKAGAERIREIVCSLRTFSRLDESDSKHVDIHPGIESTLMILQNRLKGKPGQPAISIIKNFSDLPPVECHPGQLNQVFMNLLSNAIDALEEKMRSQQSQDMSTSSEIATHFSPTIAINTGVVGRDTLRSLFTPVSGISSGVHSPTGECLRGTQTAQGKPTHVFIRIADNGSGMTQKTRQQLFDPFFTTKPVGQGTGLGLAISYQIIVEKHGGQLHFNSAWGQGSEFIIEIPLRYSSC